MTGFMKFINATARCSTLYRDERLEGSGLNGYQTPYVLTLCRNPGLTQEQLAARIHVNKSNVARQLALLEENGFIERRPCENDRRALKVYPTEKMHAALPQLEGILADWRRFVLSELTEEEQNTLGALLGRVAHKAETFEELLAEQRGAQ